jgi:predicted Zn-dependent protease
MTLTLTCRAWEDAAWYLQLAATLQPSIPFANLQLASLHLQHGDIAAAESDCCYERDHHPTSDAVQSQLAAVSLAAKQLPAAQRYLSRAIHANPSRADYWAELQRIQKLISAPPAAAPVTGRQVAAAKSAKK